jgi:hypothetical protein
VANTIDFIVVYLIVLISVSEHAPVHFLPLRLPDAAAVLSQSNKNAIKIITKISCDFVGSQIAFRPRT